MKMNHHKTVNIIAATLILCPIFMILLRVYVNSSDEDLTPSHNYTITYQFDLAGDGNYKVDSYLPVNNKRQQIILSSETDSPSTILLKGENKLARWEGFLDSSQHITFSFDYSGMDLSYQLGPEIPLAKSYSQLYSEFVKQTEFIQSQDKRIAVLADSLAADHQFLNGVISSFFNYVNEIPSAKTSELTDAVMAYENQKASCNGKSRLLVALCRNKGIPARVTGGLILEETTKRTSHLWVEIMIEGHWVPFDALNGHYAFLPSHYMQLYTGDEFLIKRSADLEFDYNYVIEQKRVNNYTKYSSFNLWGLIDEANLPFDMMKVLLLLPIGAFLVAIFKNVVGIKTYGVFLPVLISLVLLKTGLVSGLILFSSLVMVVSLVNFPLEKLGVQYNAKIGLMLIAVVVTALLAIKLLHQTQWLDPTTPLFFPIIILTIISEKFAKKVEEEGLIAAVTLFLSTALVTVLIYFILAADYLQHFIVTFPESILIVAGLSLKLGKWLGLRVLEYHRFAKVLNS